MMIAVESIVDAAAGHFGLARDRFVVRASSKAESRARRSAVYLCDRHAGLGVDALAIRFNASRTSIYNMVDQVATEIERNGAPHVAEVYAVALALQASEHRLCAGAHAASIAHRVIVDGHEPDADEIAALAHAVLRAAPVEDNPLVTALAVAAGGMLAAGDNAQSRCALQAALTALVDNLEAGSAE